MGFYELLENKYILLDGAMGTMLQKKGLKLGGIPELMNITEPDVIKDIHKEYLLAGSDIIYANTFGANRYKLNKCQYSVKEVIEKGISIAKDAIKESGRLNAIVALDLGPVGQLLEPAGTLSFDDCYDYYKEQVLAGKDADVVILETQTDLLEVKAAILAVKENSSLPIMVTMTFEENRRTFTGCCIASMAMTLSALGVDAIGVNCSLGPKELYPIVEEMTKWTRLPIIVKPNAGLPDPATNTYNVSPKEFASDVKKMTELGVKIYGGCCGTTKEYIEALKNMLEETDIPVRTGNNPCAVCSATKIVVLDEPRIIGERINPTGKKKFKEALLNNDMDYILNQGIEQIEAGADILDVNVGMPGIDEMDMMVRCIKELQGITDAPLQIDSTDVSVLEAALRRYNGVPIVNSVNGEISSMEKIFPLVKKYGALVVGLTLDENGIPKDASERFNIAKKIMNKAMEYGIPKENVLIDCLTLTASAEQAGVMETLNALKRVKMELGLKTVLGVSNISFGLPNRELVNQSFLTMALSYGLDLPIINPNITGMMGAFYAYKVLSNTDKNSVNYIERFGNISVKTTSVISDMSANTDKTLALLPIDGDLKGKLYEAICKGLKTEGAQYTEELLVHKSEDSMAIVNDVLIPALDKIGSEFEKGKVYLPQLILSAGAAQSCFEVIKNKISSEQNASISKGKVILATVKGDVHDIGKNIVKVLLENYGYTVIDLGKDVDYQDVVDAVIKYDAKLVGLSALMTTTLVSMKETIKLIRDNNLDCKVVVGGAVLTKEYAMDIGADFYAKDAKEAVDIAKKCYK